MEYFMADGKAVSRVYWDTMLFIYWLEENPKFGERMDAVWARMLLVSSSSPDWTRTFFEPAQNRTSQFDCSHVAGRSGSRC